MIDLKQCSLGIELGSTRIKAVLVGDTCKPVAQGDFILGERLENGSGPTRWRKSGRVCRLPTRHWRRMWLAKCGQPLTTVGCMAFRL